MVEGVNMGRKCPWTKEDLLNLYKQLETYKRDLTSRLLKEEGLQSAQEAFTAYNMFKFPVVYIFIHYHFGKFEDLGMNDSDIATYITMYMTAIEDFTQGIADGLRTSDVFYYDKSKKMSVMLEQVCEEVLFILKNY